ncbi:MAG TPA: hypothetical protein VMD28_10270 [Acidimicrobiales bacterium]|nr:hypothetical protein [Acidimicrobiales bacterium]
MAVDVVSGMIELVDPGLEMGERRARRAAPALGDLRGKALGSVENGKWNAGLLLELVRALLVAGDGAVEGPSHSKVHYNRDLTDDQRADLVAHADAALVAIGDCGSCTSYTIRDLVALEELGVPTVALVTEPFVGLAQSLTPSLGFEHVRIVAVEHPIYGLDREAMADRARAVAPNVRTLLTSPAPAETAPTGAPGHDQLENDQLDDGKGKDHKDGNG